MFEFLRPKPKREISSVRLARLKGDEPGVFRTHLKFSDGTAELGVRVRTSPEEQARKRIR